MIIINIVITIINFKLICWKLNGWKQVLINISWFIAVFGSLKNFDPFISVSPKMQQRSYFIYLSFVNQVSQGKGRFTKLLPWLDWRNK